MTVGYDELLEQITQSVFSTMLATDLSRDDALERDFNASMTALVHIAGAWTGCVAVSLSEKSARAVGSQLLAIPIEEIQPEDEVDCAAEVANMIGGNLKSVLPGPSHLSIPTVANGGDIGIRMDQSVEVENLYLVADFGAIRVRLYEKHTVA
jgi:chemotaxis protein CheX